MFFGVWLLLAVAVGILASNRGRSPAAWFLISAALSPLLGFVFLLVTKNLSKAGLFDATHPGATHTRCPLCAEWVLPDAIVCKHCGGTLTPQPLFREQREKEKSRLEEQKNHNAAVAVAVVFALLVALLLAALLI